MKAHDIFIVQPGTDEHASALKAFMKALIIKLEISTPEEYDAEFVKKIHKSRSQAKEGKVSTIIKSDLKQFLES